MFGGCGCWVLACVASIAPWLFTAAGASVEGPRARVVGDELIIEGVRLGAAGSIWLGPPTSLYDPPRERETLWRRSGEAGEAKAAVLISRPAGTNETELRHVFVLWETGYLELRRRDGQWLVKQADDERSFAERRLFFTWGGQRFDSCWPGQADGLLQVRTGFVIDQSFVNRVGDKVDEEIQISMSTSNVIYENQLGIHLAIGIILRPNQWEPRLSGAVRQGGSSPCTDGMNINTKLNLLRESSQVSLTQRYEVAVWVQLTDCFPPPGTVGLAYVGVLCNPFRSYAVVTYSEMFWLTVAHELGHTFGSGHSFEDGQGTTGGIMDYGDGRFQGQFQFHPGRRNELCDLLTRTMTRPTSQQIATCWSPFTRGSPSGGMWQAGDWSVCDFECTFQEGVNGKQRKDPACKDASGSVIPDESCVASQRPASEERPCQPPAPICTDAARWVFKDWTPCRSPYNLDCGAGRTTRELVCEDGNGVKADEKKCPQSRPAQETRVCNATQEGCDPKITASWVKTDEWLPGPTCVYTGSDAYSLRQEVCVDLLTLESVKERRCPGTRPMADFRRTSAPTCPAFQEPCCLDPACRDISTEGECIYLTRRLDALTCMQNPASDMNMYAFLGGFFRRERHCRFDRGPSHAARIRDGFPGLPVAWDRVDAVMSGPATSSELLLFRGDQVWKWNIEVHAPFRGYPKVITEEFPGIQVACPICAQKIGGSLYDEQSEVLRIWCGTGDVYCMSRKPWGTRIREDWVLRPSEDFAVPEVREVLQDQRGGLVLLQADSSQCLLPTGSTTCQRQSNSFPFTTRGNAPRCVEFGFCAVCSGGRCTSCEQGFKLLHGRCVHYQARLWLLDPGIAADSGGVTAWEASGAQDEAEYRRWDFIQGPFTGPAEPKAFRGRVSGERGLRMAAIRGSGSAAATLRRWSFDAWVRGRPGAAGTLLSVTYEGSLLEVTWSTCGPSVRYVAPTGDWSLACDEGTMGIVSNNEWVHVVVDFQETLTIQVNGRKIMSESVIHAVELNEGWTLGGADVDFGLVRLLDYEIWPRFNFDALSDGSKALFVVSALIGVMALLLLALAFRVKVPEGMELKGQRWCHIIIEVYIMAVNVIFSLGGAALMMATLIILAMQQIGVVELFSQIIWSAELRLLFWPFWVGFFLYLGGVVGIRTARTRDGCFLFLYLSAFFFLLWATIFTLWTLGTFNFSLPQALEDVASEGNNLVNRAQVPAMRRARNTFITLMGPAQYACSVPVPEMAACNAQLRDADIIRCEKPHPAARAFQNAVNGYCTNNFNVSTCGRCVENFGRMTNLTTWDSTDPVNRVFCKCSANLVDKGQAWLTSASITMYVVVGGMALLFLGEIYLLCCVPSKRQLLRDQMDYAISKTRSQMERLWARPAGLVPTASDTRAMEMADRRAEPGRVTTVHFATDGVVDPFVPMTLPLGTAVSIAADLERAPRATAVAIHPESRPDLPIVRASALAPAGVAASPTPRRGTMGVPEGHSPRHSPRQGGPPGRATQPPRRHTAHQHHQQQHDVII